MAGILADMSQEEDPTPLSMDELYDLAEAFPQWGISTGIANGRVFKKYTRSLADVAPGYWADNASRLSLIDPEHFDPGLSLALSGNIWSGVGEDSAGTFSVHAPVGEAGLALTYQDQQRITAAEAYLVDHGIVGPPPMSAA